MINSDDVWVEKLSLPMYFNTHDGKSKFVKLNRNYTFIKHMMGELGLVLNKDYIIVPNLFERSPSIMLMFAEHSRQYSSICVLIWGKYERAKLESNL